MKIWIVTIGEPIINNKDKLRLHRHGLLADYISKNSSYNIVWWTSSFNHFTKTFEFSNSKSLFPRKNLEIKTLKGFGYKKNVSLSRIIDHKMVSMLFAKKIKKNKEKPDIIITSFPPLGLCKEAVNYGIRNNVPVIIDYRDLWPEAFQDLFPKKIKLLAKIIFYPLSFKTKKVLAKATGIIGITDKFLEIALNKINRNKNKFDSYFYHTYKKLTINQADQNECISFWKKMGIQGDSNYINVCFFGTLGHQFDLATVINGFKQVSNLKIKLIICGSGHKKHQLIKLAEGQENIIFPGYMNANQIKVLLSQSHIGLCPYLPKKMFLNAIPGKVIEYMSEGLELLTTLNDGMVGEMVNKNNFGINYNAFDKDSFSSSLRQLYQKIKDRKNNKESIMHYYNVNYDQETVLKKYLHHIEKVIKDYA
jgi:hypothetical protein